MCDSENNQKKDINKILKINYSDTEKMNDFKSEKYKKKFDWKKYIDYYNDLQCINLNEAWEHWINHGLNEKRLFFLNEINNNTNLYFTKINNLCFKNNYNNYGLHYYGWKGVINNFIHNFDNHDNDDNDDNNIFLKNKFKEPIFFDEWIEKLLIWGNKIEKKLYLREIYNKKYKIITFIHNPPFKKWYNNDYKKNIKNQIIYNDEHTNESLMKRIEHYKLTDNIIYFYTLTNYHKEYIYNKYPHFHNKLITISHPIEITGKEKCFNFSLFLSKKKIVHIGWWLRNFKTFIDFKQPEDFKKIIQIKNDFLNEWNNISSVYNLKNIKIMGELNNNDYEKIFTNSCIFIDLEDTCANNVILECIKFNTPIIVNKNPSIIEYLGPDYPLYFKNKMDFMLLNNSSHLLSLIKKANEYLINMDKSHVSLETFNKKLNYDLSKLVINNNKQLTWFCFIDDFTNIDVKINKLYNNFISQNDNSTILLNIILCESLNDNEKYNIFLEIMNKYINKANNISLITKNCDKIYSIFLNYCCEICETDYLVIIDINDKHNKKYSNYCINYLNENPNCDVIFSSYTIKNNEYSKNYIFNKNAMIFNENYNDEIILNDTGIVWRNSMNQLVGEFISLENKKQIFTDFWSRAIKKKFNIKCCSSKILYISKME